MKRETMSRLAVVGERRDRGRLMDATEIAQQKFSGKVKAQWVRRNLRHKIYFSQRLVLWYEADVDDQIEELRQKASA